MDGFLALAVNECPSSGEGAEGRRWSGVEWSVCMYMMTVNKVEGCKVTLNTSLFEFGSSYRL